MGDARGKEISEKIRKEKMVLDGAMKMHSAQTDANARNMVEITIKESRQRLEFLQGELRKLSLKKMSESAGVNAPRTTILGDTGNYSNMGT